MIYPSSPENDKEEKTPANHPPNLEQIIKAWPSLYQSQKDSILEAVFRYQQARKRDVPEVFTNIQAFNASFDVTAERTWGDS